MEKPPQPAQPNNINNSSRKSAERACSFKCPKFPMVTWHSTSPGIDLELTAIEKLWAGLFHPPTGHVANRGAVVFGKYEKPNKKSRNMLDADFFLWEDCFKNGRSVSSFKGKCGIQANWSSRVMLKSKQGKSIETWHVGLCPHATQKDIRHTSRHDWVSTYVPKMVNILPQSQHGTKNSKSTGFPLQQHGVKFATCTSSVVGILSLLVLDTSPWEFYQSIRSVYSLPIILQPSKKQLNSAKTISNLHVRTCFTSPKQKRSPFVSGKFCFAKSGDPNHLQLHGQATMTRLAWTQNRWLSHDSARPARKDRCVKKDRN